MIVTLSRENAKKINWLKYLFINKISKEAQNVPDHIQLLNIYFKTKNGKINWKKVSKIFNNEKLELLCSRDVPIPNNINIKRFESNRYQSRLCINAALEILKKACIDANKLRIFFIDKDGHYAGEIHKFIRYSNRIGVFTRNEYIYTEEQASIFRSYGASIIFIAENLNKVKDYNFIICPEGIETYLPIDKASVCFAGAKSSSSIGTNIWYKYYIRVPSIYEKFKPREIPTEDFLEALFYEEEDRLSKLTPEKCESSQGKFLINDIVQKVKDLNH